MSDRKIMKNIFGLFAVIMLVVSVGFGCSFFDDYNQVYKVQQSGDFICIVKERLSAEYKVRSPLTKAGLFLHGSQYKSDEFPKIVVRDCTALNEQMMSLKTDDGIYFALYDTGGFKLKKLDAASSGNLSNDFSWFVTQEKKINLLTGEEIAFKAKLPSNFLGNAPDWKTIITGGKNPVDEDLISLYVVEVETGVSKERFVRRANYMFMLDSSHQIAGIVSDNLWISSQFRWLPDANGKFQLIYPVLEPEEIKKEQKKLAIK